MEPGFLAGVLQFILAHEPTLLRFAEEAGIAPGDSRQGRARPAPRQRRPRAFDMSDDPETARQIAELAARLTRPLLVLDVDEVLLEFMSPFMRFLDAQGLRFLAKSFRLTGNIVEQQTNRPLDQEAVSALLGSFFDAQRDWQTAAMGQPRQWPTLLKVRKWCMLTAMPHRHRQVRREHLDTLGFPYPLLTTEAAKGPALRQLRGESGRSVAFVDDIPHNLVSVREAVADAHLFNLMAYRDMRPLLPPLPEGIVVADDWSEAAPKIAAALGLYTVQSPRLRHQSRPVSSFSIPVLSNAAAHATVDFPANMSSGAISASGTMTKARSSMRGWGISSPASLTWLSPCNSTSMSISRGPQRSMRTRLSLRSTSRQSASNSSGASDVATSAVTFRKSGWSSLPHGGVR